MNKESALTFVNNYTVYMQYATNKQFNNYFIFFVSQYVTLQNMHENDFDIYAWSTKKGLNHKIEIPRL